MTVDLISNITRYKDYYLVISGIYSDKSITVLDKDLKTISSHPFEKLVFGFPIYT